MVVLYLDAAAKKALQLRADADVLPYIHDYVLLFHDFFLPFFPLRSLLFSSRILPSVVCLLHQC